MRIDKFLFFARLIKSRTQAQALLDEGRTRIDGRRVEKPSDTVKPGSVVALPLRGQVRIIRVLGLPERRGPAPEARTFYQEIAEGRGVDAAGGAA
ncbi:RNA-binding S4 domain-containing protein [uncultured Sphingomonas sp.]|uniref:RNA-binding S4 domain-containing protein n=1 Tax=uncultured Sphingomonas sp. TaxID=158754 RepID=UPI0025CFFF12|nr:RNA-binding S4 domain-containing protein [uncultured Sphingomonas sp.]